MDTSLSNRIAGYLIESGAVPNFKNAKIISSEVKIGRSRFDLLLENKNKRIVLEVKTCTLFNKRLAMFPDAKTERGRRQLEDLVKLSQNGTKGAILFLVHSYFPYLFLPNYHTDLDFSLTLLNSRKKIKIIALGLFWDKDFSLKKFKILKIPWRILRREAKDGGSYLLILELRKNTKIEVGSLGIVSFPKGFYIYVGKAEKNLLKRVSRHKRKLKKKHWHIDFFREFSEFKDYFLIRSAKDLECEIAQKLSKISNWRVSGFGSSDCCCFTHLFGFRNNPFHSEEFQDILAFFYMLA